MTTEIGLLKSVSKTTNDYGTYPAVQIQMPDGFTRKYNVFKPADLKATLFDLGNQITGDGLPVEFTTEKRKSNPKYSDLVEIGTTDEKVTVDAEGAKKFKSFKGKGRSSGGSGGGEDEALRQQRIVRQNALAHATAISTYHAKPSGDPFSTLATTFQLAEVIYNYSMTGKTEIPGVNVE